MRPNIDPVNMKTMFGCVLKMLANSLSRRPEIAASSCTSSSSMTQFPAWFPIASSKSHTVAMGLLEIDIEMPPVPTDTPSILWATSLIFCRMLFSSFRPRARALSRPLVPFAPQRFT